MAIDGSFLPTTRYARFLYRRERYLYRRRKYWNKKFKQHRDPVTGKRTFRPGPVAGPGPLQLPHGLAFGSYAAQPHVAAYLLTWTVTKNGWSRPPFVTITSPWYIVMRGLGRHQHRAYLRFHAKRVRAFGGHALTIRRSKRERQITGCNYFFRRNGYFPDDDVLGRHPNMTDGANGTPPSNLLWPSPLGY